MSVARRKVASIAAAKWLSLRGDGWSLAIAGGVTLANAVASQRNDLAAALTAYEQRHRRLVSSRQRLVRSAAHVLVPTSGAGVLARDTALRLRPQADAGRRALRRLPSDSHRRGKRRSEGIAPLPRLDSNQEPS